MNMYVLIFGSTLKNKPVKKQRLDFSVQMILLLM